MPNTKRGFGSVGIIIIILIILGGGAYLWSQKSVPTSPNVPVDNSLTTLPLPDEKANWKIYKDEKYGLEVKYPENYVKIGSGNLVTFADTSNMPITLVGPVQGSANFTDLFLAVAVLNIFGKTGNPDREVFLKDNMSPSPELDYLNPDLALKFKANRIESARSLPSGNYKGYVFQKNAKIYILYSLETDTVLPKMVKTFKFQDNSLAARPTSSPVFSGCEKNIILYNRKDGSSVPQKVTLGGRDYEINSHIEAEDNWASFTVDGDIGPIGKYYNSPAPNLGNPLTVKGANLADSLGHKLPFPDTIIIKSVSITLKKVGYTENRQEFAEACLNS